VGKVYMPLFLFRPQGICHLAANPAPSGQAQIDVFDNNVLSAHDLMQAAGDLGVPRVVYASSEMATGLLTYSWRDQALGVYEAGTGSSCSCPI
jgi:UDP-glucose 4-epimerase